MPYCPKCHSEYADGVLECIDCHIRLAEGRPPTSATLDLQDLVVPVGSFFCLLAAAGLLLISIRAASGQLPEPLGGLIRSTQPPCLVVFYAVAGIASAIVFAYWVARRLAGRD